MDSFVNNQNINGQLRSRVLLGILLLVITAAGVFAAFQQGVSTDERDDMLAIYWNYRYLISGEPIENNVQFYGTLFPFSSELVYQLKSLVTRGSLSTLFFERNTDLNDPLVRQEFIDRVTVKHIYTFLFSLAAYLAVAGLVKLFIGGNAAWLGVLFLALMPRFLGHSFFNPRDIPFAALFTVGTYLCAWLLKHFLEYDSRVMPIGFNRTTAWCVLLGIVIGLVSATRLAGCFLLAFMPAAHLAAHLMSRQPFRNYLRFVPLYAVTAIAWAATLTALHPASWYNPLDWFVQALSFLSRYQWEGSNLFNYLNLPGNDLPWYYLPVWLAITTPLSLLTLAGGGLVMLAINFRQLRPFQTSALLLILLQIGFLPLVAVVRGSTIYDGLRQFLFILPGLAVLAAVMAGWIFKRVESFWVRIGFVAALIVTTITILAQMISLHPYEYIYFNRLVGGLPGAHGRFDTEYFGLSMREGVEWLNENAERGVLVVSSREMHSSETFSDPDIEMISMREFDELQPAAPFYYIARPRYTLQSRFPECGIVHQVTRQNIPLTIIKKCEP